MTIWPSFTRDDLKQAASRAGFDMVFPLLIRRLIAETGIGLSELDMPGGSGVAAGGFDGISTAGEGSAFVPAGRVVWELSVSGGNTKANDDYSKRVDAPGDSSTSDVTYVQVILEPWTKSRTWETQRRNEGRWKDVRAYNLDRIHAWLDTAPAAAAWLSEELGMAIPGVRSLERWWYEVWLPSTTVELNHEVVLAGRGTAAQSFCQQLSAMPRTLVLGGGLRPDEAWAFCAAALVGSDDLATQLKVSRALLVSEAAACAALVRQMDPLVLLVADPTFATDLPADHPHTLLLLGRQGAPADVDIPPLDGEQVAALLEAAGEDHDHAQRLGIMARRSLMTLRRSLAKTPTIHLPTWAQSPELVLRRIALLGGWEGLSDGDREASAALTQLSYIDLQERARALADSAGTPMLGHVDQRWYVLDREDTWALLAPYFTSDDIAAFQQLAARVLGEVDPLHGLGETERLTAGFRGVRRKYSIALREALAETLALLSAREEVIAGRPGSDYAAQVVRQLLDEANADGSYARWASLGDVLPLLAEAAPEAFLYSLNEGLEAENTIHVAMFADQRDSITGMPSSSPHLAVLRALEILAWENKYLDAVVEILARLSAIDPGGRWSNRPAESLVSILSCWCPQSSAGVEQRLRAIARVVRDIPTAGFNLLMALIPGGHATQMMAPGPRFRGWRKQQVLTHAEVDQAAHGVAEMLIEMLGEDGERFAAVIPKLDHLPSELQIRYLQRVAELAPGLGDEERASIFEPLREMIARHREHSDAVWALPEERLADYETALAAIAPGDPLLRNRWLFESDWVTLGDLRRRDDFQAYEQAMRERQHQALSEILQDGGLERVLSLAADSKYPHVIGRSLAAASSSFDTEMLTWLNEEPGTPQAIAYAYFVGRFVSDRQPVLTDLLAIASAPETKARLLLASGRHAEAWELLPNLGEEVTAAYWRSFGLYGLGHGFAGVEQIVTALSSVGRYAAALEAAALYHLEDSPDNAELIASALEGLIAGGFDDPEINMLQHQITQIFEVLARHRETLGAQRLVHLEWQLFPLLGYEADAPTLHRALAEEPLFFAELIGLIYRTDDSADSRDEDDEHSESDDDIARRRTMATRAYEVLRSWHRCPGLQPDGSIDELALSQWVETARERLRTDKRLSTGDIQIGEVLSHAPADDEGLKPPRAVRNLIERIKSSRIERGLSIGITNSRGVTSRSLTEGGVQEWALARQYRTEAAAAEEWPRIRAVLDSVAESYEAYARRADDEAERFRQGLWT